jgi:hypothetical protein
MGVWSSRLGNGCVSLLVFPECLQDFEAVFEIWGLNVVIHGTNNSLDGCWDSVSRDSRLPDESRRRVQDDGLFAILVGWHG